MRVKLMRRCWWGWWRWSRWRRFAPRRARPDDAMWRNFRGRVMFSDIALAPAASFESSAMMTAALRRIERSTIDQTAGFWRMHVLAFLDRPAPTSALGAAGNRRHRPRAPREVRVFEVPVERGDEGAAPR